MTGSTGFIGGYIRNHFESLGHEVHGCSRSPVGGRSKYVLISGDSVLKHDYDARHFIIDLKDAVSVQKMLSEVKPEAIIHCAANPLVKPDPDNPTGVYDDNVKSTHLLCHYAPKGCIFIFTSSIVVYGDICKEQNPCESMWPSPTSMYGVSKVAAENIISFYNHVYPIIFRLGATIGPNLTHGIIYDFIRKLKGPDEFLEVLGDEPGSSKPFLHISDLVGPMELAITRSLAKGCNTYNICNNDQASVKDIAEAVKTATGINKEVKWLGSGANWKGDNNVLRADIELITKVGSWYPKLSSIDAIKEAVKENL